MSSYALTQPIRIAARGVTTLTLVTALVATAAIASAGGAGVRPHVELSDSMRPVLRAGDVVWLADIPAANARRGDVVAFERPGSTEVLLHRVEAVRPSGTRLAFTTRGDANSGVERWTIDRDGRVGRYAGVRLPAVGRAIRAVQVVPPVLLAVVSGLVLAALVLRRIWR